MGASPDTISVGNVEILPHERLVRVAGRDVQLTRREFDVLEMMASHPGWVFSAEQLAGEQLLDYTSPLAVNVHVAHIRQKLAEAGVPKLIITVRGSGYKLVPPPEPAGDRAKRDSARPADGLIGRELELDALGQAWDDVKAGSGRIVLVAGDPGIGKTALVDNAVAGWPHEEFEYVRAVCDGNGSGEHWMWRQVLPEIARRTGIGFEAVDDGGLLRAILGEGGRAPTESLSGADRTLAYDAVSRYLARIADAHPRPVVLFVDDLHWADVSSLKLLVYLARRFVGIDLLLVLTTRDPIGRAAQPLADTLADVSRSDACIHLHLEGLSAGNVAEAVGRVLGREDERLSELLAEQTGGNPLYLLEALRVIKTDGGADGDALQLRADPRFGRAARSPTGCGAAARHPVLPHCGFGDRRSVLPVGGGPRRRPWGGGGGGRACSRSPAPRRGRRRSPQVPAPAVQSGPSRRPLTCRPCRDARRGRRAALLRPAAVRPLGLRGRPPLRERHRPRSPSQPSASSPRRPESRGADSGSRSRSPTSAAP